jgi:hypothetical protein
MRIKHRLFMLVFVFFLATSSALIFAQGGEPMTNPDCNAQSLAESSAQIDQLYTDSQTAFADGDMRDWLDNLRAMSWLSSSLRAFCDGYSFGGDAEGSNSTVIGPVIFQPGIYTVTATTDGYMTARLEAISGGCGSVAFSMVISEGNAANGAQEVLRVEDEPCTALLQVGNLTEEWTLEFSLIAGDQSGESSLNLGDVVVAENLDSNGCAVNVTDTFDQNDTIYVVLTDSAIPEGTTVFTRLYYENEPVEDSDEITAPQDFSNVCVNFAFENSEGWDEGDYEIEFYVNGSAYQSASFTVSD